MLNVPTERMKILNLYAGIGGNRKLWGEEHDITAIEINPKIAEIYADYFPNDTIIIKDAHQYLLDHFNDYDFIWSSPPCPTHSITRFMLEKKVYPDMKLYQEIIFLRQWFKGKYVVENVTPYYRPLITPDYNIHRHAIWCNFMIQHREYPKLKTCKAKNERELLQRQFGYDLDDYGGVDKRTLLRNCVVPEMGLDIFKDMLSSIGEQMRIFDSDEPSIYTRKL